MTLSGFVSWLVVLAIVAASGTAGYYALTVLYANKLNDTWAIMFLELERQGNQIAKMLEKHPEAAQGDTYSKDDSSTGVSAIWRDADAGFVLSDEKSLRRIKGAFPEKLSAQDFGLGDLKLSHRWNVLQFSGQEYLGRIIDSRMAALILHIPTTPSRQYLALWKIDLAGWFLGATRTLDRTAVYVITKEGKLVFSNSPEITAVTFAGRPLVQKFIQIPFRQGQLEFKNNQHGEDTFGFFHEVPDTNLVMFAETTKASALGTVRSITGRFLVVFAVILFVALIILQFPLVSLTNPIRSLVRLAGEISRGNFNVVTPQGGFGEIKLLSDSFFTMGQSLALRDQRINSLMREQQEKFRLEGELAIAKRIQDNFLPHEFAPKSASGIEVSARYVPAAEVAGDWYGYGFDEASGETVVAIADVSGHGTGSAMFTAVIAGLFEDFNQVSRGKFPLEAFTSRLNRTILRLGKGKWDATALIIRHVKGQGTLELINAGHCFPLVMPPLEAKKPVSFLNFSSNPLGLFENFEPTREKLYFPKGSSILLYTDGLTEARSKDEKQYGRRRLRSVCQNSSRLSMESLIENIFEDWKSYAAGGDAPLDDLCLVAARAW